MKNLEAQILQAIAFFMLGCALFMLMRLDARVEHLETMKRMEMGVGK